MTKSLLMERKERINKINQALKQIKQANIQPKSDIFPKDIAELGANRNQTFSLRDSFIEARDYFRQNSDLFVKSQFEFLISIESYWISNRLSPKQAAVYIETVNYIRDNEEFFIKRYRK